jgi:hypothetical protein
MPFKPISRGKNKGKYRSPGGKVMTGEQIRAYFSKKGTKKG